MKPIFNITLFFHTSAPGIMGGGIFAKEQGNLVDRYGPR
jgi:hypothetical protein